MTSSLPRLSALQRELEDAETHLREALGEMENLEWHHGVGLAQTAAYVALQYLLHDLPTIIDLSDET